MQMMVVGGEAQTNICDLARTLLGMKGKNKNVTTVFNR